MQHVDVYACDKRGGSEFLRDGISLLFIIRQLRRMTKRPRGRKRIISPELIAFPEIRRLPTYLPYCISFACKLQLSRYLELRDALCQRSNLPSLGITYLSTFSQYSRATRPSNQLGFSKKVHYLSYILYLDVYNFYYTIIFNVYLKH